MSTPHSNAEINPPTTHTPGPWQVEPVPPEIHDDPDMQHSSESDAFWIVAQSIDEVIAVVHRYPEHEVEANARVIAAVPDLLDALKEAVRDIPGPFYESMCHAGITTMEKCARCSRAARIYAAIAKAEGVTSDEAIARRHN